jgi:hypothetical protein
MADIDPNVLLNQLARYTANGALNSQYSLPVLGRLAAATPPLNGGELIEALLQHGDPAVAGMVPRVQAARHSAAAQLHAARRDKRLSSTQTVAEQFPLLADLPLDVQAGWTTLERPLKRLVSALSVGRDARFAAARQREAPRTAAALELELAEILNDSDAQVFPPDRRFVVSVVKQARPHCADDAEATLALDRLQTHIDQLRETDETAVKEVLDNLPAAGAIPASLDEETVLDELVQRHRESATSGDGHRWLDELCTRPGVNAARRLVDVLQTNDDRERASLIFTLRDGPRNLSGWPGWKNWLLQSSRVLQRQQEELGRIGQQSPMEVLVLWCRQQSGMHPEIETALESWCRSHAPATDADRFVDRWETLIPNEELSGLLGDEYLAEDVFITEEEPTATASQVDALPRASQTAPARRAVESAAASRTVDLPKASVPKPSQPIGPPPPSVWRDHVQPFFVENWYMVAGVLMVIAGSSLLAWYTWDKHWAVRYTIMPTLLAGFTWALGAMGTWVERQDKQFEGTAAILRGAAIALLPINFMAIALLSNDEQVGQKVLVVPLLGMVYLSLGAWGLKTSVLPTSWVIVIDASEDEL